MNAAHREVSGKTHAVTVEGEAAIVFADGRVVQLSDVDAWNLGEGVLAAVRHHAHPSTKQVYRDLHARLMLPAFEVMFPGAKHDG